MRLTDAEKAMRDGAEGAAVAKAMDLLIRYGEALGAEALVETRNVCGTVTATTPFLRDFAIQKGGLDAVFSEFNLDSQDVVVTPKVKAFSSHLQLGFDPHHPVEMGVSEEIVQFYKKSEAAAAKMGVQILNTCTPYQVGNVPTRGEHLAWMESSAVVFANSALGARTNTEGRESTSCAMLTQRIPDWGFHRDEGRRGTLGVHLDIPVESVEDWGLFGYWMGDWVQERVPVVTGVRQVPNLPKLKHFGAAASSSGGVEMYHLVGVTPEANTLEQAFGGNKASEVRHYGARERAATLERINANGTDRKVDYVMLGCPHYTIEQIWEAAQLLEGRKVHANSALWIFTPRAIKEIATRNGYTAIIEAAGGKIMTDSCSAMSRAVPPGTQVVALDSAKQAHYLPAILGLQAWFGTTAQCIDAACTGQWNAA
ncbi:aconitase X catalytic domain-containing protein [Ramlibacter sp. XY19]|uniref:aconitase X catalytic domain-containing protein n=1 Tax=Ramlibacter paludis TaxID=2908000 RepID=UPI0023DBF3A7|nr:aconitase X catalytic domain-containing protein [Ramlibacter paludis]MCG2594354.1 aconitase X catalytic domain-containing protein [Ramlibacter paludis]